MKKLFTVLCVAFAVNSCTPPMAVAQEIKKDSVVAVRIPKKHHRHRWFKFLESNPSDTVSQQTYYGGKVPVMYKFYLWPVAPRGLFSLSFSPVYDWPMDWPNNR